MGFHHVALATKDVEGTHRFYTEAMGFELVKVVAGPTPGDRGWSRHFFYDTGASSSDEASGPGMIAFWDLHDAAIGDSYRTDLAKAVGLPVWVNHLAFDAADLDELAGHRERWQAYGITVAEVDHGFCTSIYATDPNGIMVEFCCTTRPFSVEERDDAARLLVSEAPELEPEPSVTIHEPVAVSAPA